MKKLVLLFCLFIATKLVFAQGAPPYSANDSLSIYNYSKWTVYGGTITAINETSPNWTPVLTASTDRWIRPYLHPSGDWWTVYKKFNNSHSANIPITSWRYYVNTIPNGTTVTSPNFMLQFFGTNAGWGGLLSEYDDIENGISGGYIGVGYHYSPPPYNNLYTYPWVHTDTNLTATSFYVGNNYYIIVV